MSILVEQQDEIINVIEAQAGEVEKDVEVGCACSLSFGARSALTSSTVQTWVHRQGRGFRARSTEKALDLLHHHPHSPHHRWYCHRGCRHQQQQKVDTRCRTLLLPTAPRIIWIVDSLFLLATRSSFHALKTLLLSSCPSSIANVRRSIIYRTPLNAPRYSLVSVWAK
ncbi:hypothetical protein BV25DRAFT_1693597 [Artomyces pyxidatus]|uniref:Uncharacterized protein n=1 Tax=Artomyces pyxidatus TaxID=48021 RepID=A0ACB8TAY3_9AGAM|nr:hypothetical protein BV25DRAFT_1693597 [Artomyces pyxidatus]